MYECEVRVKSTSKSSVNISNNHSLRPNLRGTDTECRVNILPKSSINDTISVKGIDITLLDVVLRGAAMFLINK